MQHSIMGGEMPMPDFPVDMLEEMVDTLSVKYWIAKDTYYPTKAEVIINIEITPEDVGVTDEEGSITMNIGMNSLMYDYNESVSIELPTEAEDAIEEEIPW